MKRFFWTLSLTVLLISKVGFGEGAHDTQTDPQAQVQQGDPAAQVPSGARPPTEQAGDAEIDKLIAFLKGQDKGFKPNVMALGNNTTKSVELNNEKVTKLTNWAENWKKYIDSLHSKCAEIPSANLLKDMLKEFSGWLKNNLETTAGKNQVLNEKGMLARVWEIRRVLKEKNKAADPNTKEEFLDTADKTVVEHLAKTYNFFFGEGALEKRTKADIEPLRNDEKFKAVFKNSDAAVEALKKGEKEVCRIENKPAPPAQPTPEPKLETSSAPPGGGAGGDSNGGGTGGGSNGGGGTPPPVPGLDQIAQGLRALQDAFSQLPGLLNGLAQQNQINPNDLLRLAQGLVQQPQVIQQPPNTDRQASNQSAAEPPVIPPQIPPFIPPLPASEDRRNDAQQQPFIDPSMFQQPQQPQGMDPNLLNALMQRNQQPNFAPEPPKPAPVDPAVALRNADIDRQITELKNGNEKIMRTVGALQMGMMGANGAMMGSPYGYPPGAALNRGYPYAASNVMGSRASLLGSIAPRTVKPAVSGVVTSRIRATGGSNQVLRNNPSLQTAPMRGSLAE